MINIAYILIPALPFAAFLIIALRSRWLGEQSHRLATPAVTGSFILSVLACIDVYQNGARSIPLYSLINVGNLAVEASLYIDAITAVVLLLVTGVSSLVHVFSSRYMQADPRYARFFAVIALFTSAMIMLVMSANLLMLFMFWEIMGLCSYQLISHAAHRPSACDAATKAFLVNGVADVGLAFGIYLAWDTFGTVNIQEILTAAPNYTDQTVNLLRGFFGLDWQVPILSLIALLLFVGPLGKSAQIPFHVWLPFAMEAPTPVSALIHAGTMVNAGVYLLIRMGPLYLLAPNIMIMVAIFGGLTALFAALVALTQFDIKRILAYSTISQLGFMVLACGVGAYAAALFHLLTHGAMKSFLFLSAGSALEGLGGAHQGESGASPRSKTSKAARQHIPLYAGALILALIPPLVIFSGPYERLWTASQLIQSQIFFWVFGLATVFFTAFYLFQGVMDIFKPPGRIDWREGFRQGMMRPQLFSASLLLGLIPMTAGLAAFLVIMWSGFLEFVSPALPTTEHVTTQTTGWTPTNMLIGIGIAIAGWAMAFLFYAFPGRPSERWAERKKTLYVFFLNRGYFDEVVEAMIVRPYSRFAAWLWRVIDLGIIDRVYMTSAHATAKMSRWLWGVIDLGTIDRFYMTLAHATAKISRVLWQGIDGFLIDRPANGLATALFNMSAKFSKVVDVKKTTESELSRIMLVMLVMVLILLVVARILISVILD